MRIEEEQEDRDWAENELGLVQLGDKRLTTHWCHWRSCETRSTTPNRSLAE
jgi:hypothetical protein